MSRRRYIVVESAISMGINATLSMTFALLVFGRLATVDLGTRQTLLDMLPQSFMVALLAALVPSLIARGRTAAGRLRFGAMRPVRLMVVAPAAGVLAAMVGTALYALLIPGGSAVLPVFVVFKSLYGAVLGGAITALTLNRALGEEAVK